MCYCIDEVQQKLTSLMVQQNPGCEIEEKVTFQNISWVIGENMIEMLNNPVLGKYRIGNKVKKWETQMFPTFCPFCGKKYKDNEIAKP